MTLGGLAHTSSFGDGNLTGQGTLEVQSDFSLTTKGTFQVVFSPGNVVHGDITIPDSVVFDQNDVRRRNRTVPEHVRNGDGDVGESGLHGGYVFIRPQRIGHDQCAQLLDDSDKRIAVRSGVRAAFLPTPLRIH